MSILKPILDQRPQRPKPIAKASQFFGVAWGVGNVDLGKSDAALGKFRRNLRFDFKAARLQMQLAHQCRRDNFVARLHIGELRADE